MGRAGKLTAAGRKKRAGKHVRHAKAKPHAARRLDPLLSRLSDAEYAYMIDKGGEGYPERAYGVSYGR